MLERLHSHCITVAQVCTASPGCHGRGYPAVSLALLADGSCKGLFGVVPRPFPGLGPSSGSGVLLVGLSRCRLGVMGAVRQTASRPDEVPCSSMCYWRAGLNAAKSARHGSKGQGHIAERTSADRTETESIKQASKFRSTCWSDKLQEGRTCVLFIGNLRAFHRLQMQLHGTGRHALVTRACQHGSARCPAYPPCPGS